MSRTNLPASQVKVSKLDYMEDNGERHAIVDIPQLKRDESVSFELQLGPKTDATMLPFVTIMSPSTSVRYSHTANYVAEGNKIIVTVHNLGPLPAPAAKAAVFIKPM